MAGQGSGDDQPREPRSINLAGPWQHAATRVDGPDRLQEVRARPQRLVVEVLVLLVLPGMELATGRVVWVMWPSSTTPPSLRYVVRLLLFSVPLPSMTCWEWLVLNVPGGGATIDGTELSGEAVCAMAMPVMSTSVITVAKRWYVMSNPPKTDSPSHHDWWLLR
jgi:hypothetical protein